MYFDWSDPDEPPAGYKDNGSSRSSSRSGTPGPPVELPAQNQETTAAEFDAEKAGPLCSKAEKKEQDQAKERCFQSKREDKAAHDQEEQHQLQQRDGELWAATRLRELQEELRKLGSQRNLDERRKRLRALQLESHPDKQPSELRPFAQPLFLLVQQEWEAFEAMQRLEDQRQKQSAAKEHYQGVQAMRQARIRKEEEAKRQREEEAKRRREREEMQKVRSKKAEEARRKKEEQEQLKRQQEIDQLLERRAKEKEQEKQSAEAEQERQSKRGGSREDVEEHNEEDAEWSEETDEAEDSLAFPAVRQLLRANSFSKMMDALTTIEFTRLTLSKEESEQAELRRHEAEAYRQYAWHQVQAGPSRLGIAITGYLNKAIELDPGRARLYLERAQLLSKKELITVSMSIERMSSKGQQLVLDDCEAALARDASLSAAYKMALDIYFARGDLTAAEALAARGADSAVGTVQSSAKAKIPAKMYFKDESNYARTVRLGLEQAQAMLKSNERKSGEVQRVVRKLEVLAGPRVNIGGLSQKLKGILRNAETQKRFAEARDKVADTFDDAYAQLFSKR